MKHIFKKKQFTNKDSIHDLLFKAVFEHKKFAQELFSLFLSPKEMKLFNWNTLTLEKDSLKNKRADLIFSIKLKKPPFTKTLIFFLLEHKSQFDPLLPLQILQYKTLMCLYFQKTMNKVPPIISFVFCHGKKPWKTKGVFKEVFDKSALSPEFDKHFGQDLLHFRTRVLDINAPGMRKKIQGLNSALALEVLRRAWDFPLSQEEIVSLLKLLKGVGEKDQENLLLSVFDYCLKRGVSRDVLEIAEEEVFKTGILRKGGNMTLLEYTKREERRKGIKQGMQQGMQKGRQERDREVILNMLKEKADISFVAKVTGLSEKEIKKLKNGS